MKVYHQHNLLTIGQVQNCWVSLRSTMGWRLLIDKHTTLLFSMHISKDQATITRILYKDKCLIQLLNNMVTMEIMEDIFNLVIQTWVHSLPLLIMRIKEMEADLTSKSNKIISITCNNLRASMTWRTTYIKYNKVLMLAKSHKITNSKRLKVSITMSMVEDHLHFQLIKKTAIITTMLITQPSSKWRIIRTRW